MDASSLTIEFISIDDIEIAFTYGKWFKDNVESK